MYDNEHRGQGAIHIWCSAEAAGSYEQHADIKPALPECKNAQQTYSVSKKLFFDSILVFQDWDFSSLLDKKIVCTTV